MLLNIELADYVLQLIFGKFLLIPGFCACVDYFTSIFVICNAAVIYVSRGLDFATGGASSS